MNLEAMTLEVRPRTPWEAMDLAVRLAVTHWRLLLSSWMVTVLPLFLIINIILLEDYPYWAFFLVWFLKPLYDRAPLFVLSRVIFSEKTSWKDVISAIPTFFKTGLFSSLTLYRLDPSRAFSLPIRQLEGLKGKPRRQRMRTLGRSYNNREVVFFILCFHLEVLISYGLIAMLLIVLPTDWALEGAESFFMDEEPGLLVNVLSTASYFLVMMVVEILYVSGGFVLYLNRRIILEGWDIELAFRKLSQRHAAAQKSSLKNSSLKNKAHSLATMVLCSTLFMLGNSLPQTAQANAQNSSTAYEKILPPIAIPPLAPEASAETIHQVINDPVFNRFKQIETLKYTGKTDKDEERKENYSWLTDIFEAIGQTLALLFEIGLWILALIAVILLVKFRHQLHLGLGRLFKSKEILPQPPEMLFGLDLTEESLPDDVVAQALELYQKQQYRASLALLYRATLAYLVKNYEFELSTGATEGDCLTFVTKKLALPSQAEVNYFVDLTRAWQQTAYAHRAIPAEKMERLCLDWSRFYVQKNVQKNKQEDKTPNERLNDG